MTQNIFIPSSINYSVYQKTPKIDHAMESQRPYLRPIRTLPRQSYQRNDSIVLSHYSKKRRLFTVQDARLLFFAIPIGSIQTESITKHARMQQRILGFIQFQPAHLTLIELKRRSFERRTILPLFGHPRLRRP